MLVNFRKRKTQIQTFKLVFLLSNSFIFLLKEKEYTFLRNNCKTLTCFTVKVKNDVTKSIMDLYKKDN